MMNIWTFKAWMFFVAAVLTAASLAGCGKGGGPLETSPAAGADSGAGTAGNIEKNGEVQSLPAITVGASPSPHAKILEAARGPLKDLGYDLVIREYSDYVQPDLALEAGELDANYYQHLSYLEDFNEERGTNLVSAGAVHYEPFGIYPGRTKELKALKDGAAIAVPNDATNEARALRLLEAAGLIQLKEGAGLKLTRKDIADNPRGFKIMEIEAAQLPRSLQDVDLAVINGNFALQAGLKPSDALDLEDTDAAGDAYSNVIAVKAGHQEDRAVQALLKAVRSDTVKRFMETEFGGGVVPLY